MKTKKAVFRIGAKYLGEDGKVWIAKNEIDELFLETEDGEERGLWDNGEGLIELPKDILKTNGGLYPERNVLISRIEGYLEMVDLSEQTRYVLNHILKI